jgi:hypothetical protein
VDILGPQFGVNGKYNITVRNCLLHDAGFPPDPSPEYCTQEWLRGEGIEGRDGREEGRRERGG